MDSLFLQRNRALYHYVSSHNLYLFFKDAKEDEFILVPASESQYTTFSHVLADVEANSRELLDGPDIQTVSSASHSDL